MEKLKSLRDHLRNWLERNKKAQDVVPLVQQTLELTEWQLAAFEQRPPEAREIPTRDLEEHINFTHRNAVAALPMMPDYDPRAVTLVNTITASGTVFTYQYVGQIGDLGTQQAREYAEGQASAYQKLQASQDRPRMVRESLRNALAPTLEGFDSAYRAYYAAKSGTGERTAAALEMRTLLDAVQGELFQKARRMPKENMTWEKMSERLLPNPGRTLHRSELLRQKGVRSAIMDDLSTMAKQREGARPKNIDDVWTRLLDHLYIVLKLLDF